MPSISIVTPFLNGLDLLPDYEHATIGAELIIVDNASDVATAEALQTLPSARGRVLRNEVNTGFAAANNQGYREARGDIIIFLNSDIAGDPTWLKLVSDDVRDGALYGPSVNRQLVYGIWLPYIEGWCIAATRKTWERLCTITHPGYVTRDYGDGKMVRILAGADAAVKHGPWDAAHYPGPYWEDNDLCFRAQWSEPQIAITQTQWHIQHKGGRSAGPLVRYGDTFERNRATFASRVKPVWERMQER